MSTGPRKDDSALEAAADELIRTHGGFGRRSGIYREDTLIHRRRREVSLEEVAEQQGCRLRIPDDALRRLIGRALRDGCTRPQAMVWVLDEMGLGQREIARVLGITQQAVADRLRRARSRLWDYLERSTPALIVFARESHRLGYSPPRRRPPLPRTLQEARRILESAGWDTWILPEDVRKVLLVRGGVVCEALSARQLISRAERLRRGKKSRKC